MLVAGVMSVVFGAMLAETALSRRNERRLRAAGAREPDDDVIGWMRVAYPAGFVAIGVEALARPGSGATAWPIAGGVAFVLAKGLKYWAIASLADRWSFRVLVIDGAPLVTSGPYRWLRHPNYVAVAGEYLAVALALRAPLGGAAALAGFGWLMRRRIQVEERMLYSASFPPKTPELP